MTKSTAKLKAVPNRHQATRTFDVLYNAPEDEWSLIFRDPGDDAWFVMGSSDDESTIRAALVGMQRLQLTAVPAAEVSA